MKPKFSIIVPIYKVERFIPQCVDSLLNQSFEDYEIILVDDGSPDSCPAICDEYAKDNDLVTVIHKRNGGLVSARQAGAMAARGEYICCVDGDDFVSNNYLSEIKKITERYKPDVLCFNYSIFYGNETKEVSVFYREGYYRKSDIEDKIFPNLIMAENGTYFLPAIWAKVYKRDLYLRYQMLVDQRITMGEDGACTIPIIYQANSLYILNESIYFYRHNSQSMTKAKRCYDWDNQVYISKLLYSQIDVSIGDFKAQMYRRIARGFFNTAKSQFYKAVNYKTIKKEILLKMDDIAFKDSIQKCTFKGNIRFKIMEICLKKKLVFFIYIASKL